MKAKKEKLKQSNLSSKKTSCKLIISVAKKTFLRNKNFISEAKKSVE